MRRNENESSRQTRFPKRKQINYVFCLFFFPYESSRRDSNSTWVKAYLHKRASSFPADWTVEIIRESNEPEGGSTMPSEDRIGPDNRRKLSRSSTAAKEVSSLAVTILRMYVPLDPGSFDRESGTDPVVRLQ